MTEQNEPSMEDILASIRNILADEESGDAVSENNAEPSVKEAVAAPADREADVSAEAVQERTEVQNIPENISESEAEPEIDDEEILNLTSEMIVRSQEPAEPAAAEVFSAENEEEDDFTPEPVIPQKPLKEETLSDLIQEKAMESLEDEDILLSAPTVQAAAQTLSHLRDFASDRKMRLGSGDLTIEAIVRETLKPFLKEWLDVNLPGIVERVVKKEVAHIMDRLDLK